MTLSRKKAIQSCLRHRTLAFLIQNLQPAHILDRRIPDDQDSRCLSFKHLR